MAAVKDHGYAWVVLAAMFSVNVLHSAHFVTLGIFMVEFVSFFGTSTSTVTWIGALHMFIGNVACLLSGPILKRFGCRSVLIFSSLLICASFLVCGFFRHLPVVYTFFGAFSGIGYVFLYIGGVVSCQQWFDKRRSLASGIVMAGLSTGSFIWPPVTRWLIDSYTWSGALIVMGGVLLNGIVAASLLRASPGTYLKEEMRVGDSADAKSKKSTVPSSLLCHNYHVVAPFCLFSLGAIGLQIGHMNMFLYTPARAKEIHLDHNRSPFLLSAVGFAGLVGRPVAGWIGDRSWINRTVMYGCCACLVGCLQMASTVFESFESLLAVSVLFGLLSAGYVGITGAVFVDIVGLNNLEVATGINVATLGIGNVLLNALAGTILDLTGSTDVLFLVFGAAELAGGTVIMLVPLLKRALSQEIKQEGDSS